MRFGLPQNTEQPFPSATILKACNTAKHLLKFQWDPVLKELLIEKDPLKRVQIALVAQKEEIITATILDAHASLEPAQRFAFSSRLFPILVEKFPDLPALIFENLSMDIQKIQSLKRTVDQIPTHGSRYKLADRIAQKCSVLPPSDVWIEHILWLAFREEVLHDITAVIDFCEQLHLFCQEF